MIANNAALSTLGRVVSSLVEKDGQRASHIAYKDNPLTDLLKCDRPPRHTATRRCERSRRIVLPLLLAVRWQVRHRR
jgi:hypothetical protein